MIKYILASASPRRKELLQQLQIEFIVQVATKEEIITEYEPSKVVASLALQKAKEIYAMQSGSREQCVIIAADTIVALDNEILGKPKNKEMAIEMLHKISGNIHKVYTGVCILEFCDEKMQEIVFEEVTKVKFISMTEEEILDYVATGDPMDKAGAYGIQGIGAKFIESIEGDYFNVVGLPISKLYQKLKEMKLLK